MLYYNVEGDSYLKRGTGMELKWGEQLYYETEGNMAFDSLYEIKVKLHISLNELILLKILLNVEWDDATNECVLCFGVILGGDVAGWWCS